MTDNAKNASTNQSESAKAPANMDAKRTRTLKLAVFLASGAVVFSVAAVFFMDAPPRVSRWVWGTARIGYAAIACGYLAMHVWELRQHLRRVGEREARDRRWQQAKKQD